MHYLNINQLLIAGQDIKLPGIRVYTRVLEDIATQLGRDIADQLGVELEREGDFDNDELVVGFGPSTDNLSKKVPWQLAEHDSSSDWVVENGVAPKRKPRSPKP